MERRQASCWRSSTPLGWMVLGVGAGAASSPRRRGLARAGRARRRLPAAARCSRCRSCSAAPRVDGRPAARARAGDRGRARSRPACVVTQHRRPAAAADHARAARSARRCTATASRSLPAGGSARGVLHDPHRAPRRDPRSGRPPPGAATRSAIFSRDVAWTPVREMLVRPPMVPLDSLGAGLLRDLEGVSTDAVSQSDLAFHALREYVPGDDLRHVHWRSSAKAMASDGETSPAGPAVPRHPAQPRHDRGRRPARRRGRTPRTSRRRCRWPPRSPSARCSTSSRCRSSAGPPPPPAPTATWPSTRSAAPSFGRHGLVAAGPPGHVVAPDTSLLFLVGGPATDFNDLLRGVGGLPARGAPLRDPHRPDGHQPGHRDRRPAGAAPRRQGRPRRPPPVERAMSRRRRPSTRHPAPQPPAAGRPRRRSTWSSSSLLTALALSGLATSFTGSGFLVVGMIGVVLAIARHARVRRALRWPLDRAGR